MTMTYEEALAQTIAPGQMFEVVEETIGGVTNRVFKLAPETPGCFWASMSLNHLTTDWPYS